MPYFQKKPVVVQAIQHNGSKDNLAEILRLGPNIGVLPEDADGTFCLQIVTLEGTMTAHPLDWIIQGVHGEIYPCKPDIFAETYEEVGAPRYPWREGA